MSVALTVDLLGKVTNHGFYLCKVFESECERSPVVFRADLNLVAVKCASSLNLVKVSLGVQAFLKRR